jgi:hypothetical protein
MMEGLEGRARYTLEDERLQDAFRALLKPNHYSYGAAGRIGRDFLRRHADLMFDEGEGKAMARAAAGSR